MMFGFEVKTHCVKTTDISLSEH